MKVITEESLADFGFWSGAAETAIYLTDSDFYRIEEALEEYYPDGMTDTQINDFFWFEEDTIADILGFESWEVLWEERNYE